SLLPALHGAPVDVHPPRELLVRPATSQTSRTDPPPDRLWGEPHEEGKSATARAEVSTSPLRSGMPWSDMPYVASGCGAARMLAAVALGLVGGLGSLVAAANACGGYSYAGVQDARAASGIRATLVQVDTPRVARGHVAAWVGVGGPGQGAGGRDEWIQIG